MEGEKAPELNPADKEAVNKAGWQGEAPESGAAIIVRSPEEGEKIKDLGTYLRLHKTIVTPSNEITVGSEKLVPGHVSIGYNRRSIDRGILEIRYVDKEGNLVKSEVNLQDIEEWEEVGKKVFETMRKDYSINNPDMERLFIRIQEELTSYGFKPTVEANFTPEREFESRIRGGELDSNTFGIIFEENKKLYQQRLRENAHKEASKKFDF